MVKLNTWLYGISTAAGPHLNQLSIIALGSQFSAFNGSTSMASPSDSSKQEGAIRRQNKGPPFKFLVPLVYAPVLPLIRLSLRHKPVLRDRLFTAVLAGAFAHGFYLVTDLYDAESK